MIVIDSEMVFLDDGGSKDRPRSPLSTNRSSFYASSVSISFTMVQHDEIDHSSPFLDVVDIDIGIGLTIKGEYERFLWQRRGDE